VLTVVLGILLPFGLLHNCSVTIVVYFRNYLHTYIVAKIELRTFEIQA
jgi:hypothetical protein